jgi:hypothetical protein
MAEHVYVRNQRLRNIQFANRRFTQQNYRDFGLGATLEERDLIRVFGDKYRAYRKRVAMLIPWPKSS